MGSWRHGSEAAGGAHEQEQESPPNLRGFHNRLTSVTSSTSDTSSVPPAVFSEPSRTRSNTPSSAASSGDEHDHQNTPEGALGRVPKDRSQAPPRSSSVSSTSPSFSPRLLHAQAINSGHRPSQQLDSIPQGEDLELPELSHSTSSFQEQRRSTEYGSVPSCTPLSAGSRVQTDDSLIPPSITESWWSHPREWRPRSWPTRSVYFVQANMKPRIIYGVLTLIITLFAAATAAYFAWRTYIVQLWQSEHDYFDWCRQALVSPFLSVFAHLLTSCSRTIQHKNAESCWNRNFHRHLTRTPDCRGGTCSPQETCCIPSREFQCAFGLLTASS
jgi:hypothetical protein